tara:strand:+ start:6401 stop:6676 length:276 start_codon:yes stop_codon:yes gene_type:complete
MDKMKYLIKQLVSIEKLIKNKDKKKEYDKKYSYRNKERIREYNKRYYDRNKEKICAYYREYHKNKRIVDKHTLFDNSKSEMSQKDLVINFT